MQKATYTVTQVNNCTLLFVLVQMQQCATVAQMLRHCDGLLDELNGLFDDDMQQCALQITADGDVVYTQQCTYENAQDVTARKYAHVLHELLEDGEDASYEDAQAYCMLAIVQRNMFVASMQ